MFYNKNAGNPNSWMVDFDRSQQAFTNSLERQFTIRLTWQATPRNKFNVHWAEQYNDANYGPGGGTATVTPEASSRVLYIPSRQPHATWQSPITGKLLAEAGWGMYQARYRFGMRNDGSHNPAMIQRLEQPGQPRLYPGPPLADAPRARTRRIHAFVDRQSRQPAGVADLRDRLPQHEVRISGRLRQPIPDLSELHSGRAGPDVQRPAEPVDADDHGRA